MTQDNGDTHDEQENSHDGKGGEEEPRGRSYKDQESEEEFTEGLEHGSDSKSEIRQLY